MRLRIILLILLISSNCFAVTEFVSTVNWASEDYNTLTLWEDATDENLTAADILVFSHSGKNGTIPVGGEVKECTPGGAEGDAQGKLVAWTSTQILLKEISGTWDSGNLAVYDDDCGDETNYVTLTSAGDTPICTASCYDDDGVLPDNVFVSGATTDSTHYRKITAPEGERHNGKINNRIFYQHPTPIIVVATSGANRSITCIRNSYIISF